jgi:hypothetical protein
MPEFITYIGESAFFNCRNIRELIIPKSVEEIKDKAFSNCRNLEKITVFWKEPLSMFFAPDAFSEVNVNTILYVPYGTSSLYYNSFVWGDFYIQEMPPTLLTNTNNSEIKVYAHNRTIIVENAVGVTGIYDIWGRCVASGTSTKFLVPQSGIYIVKNNNIARKVSVQ